MVFRPSGGASSVVSPLQVTHCGLDTLLGWPQLTAVPSHPLGLARCSPGPSAPSERQALLEGRWGRRPPCCSLPWASAFTRPGLSVPLGESGPIWPSPQPSFHFPGAAVLCSGVPFNGCDLVVAGSQQAGLGCSGWIEPRSYTRH